VVDDALGEEILYWACKQVDGNHKAGTYPRSAADALTMTGQSAAALWPYDGLRDDATESYSPPAPALVSRAMRKATLSPVHSDLNSLRDRLRAGHAIVLGLELWADFYAAHDGALDNPEAGDLLGAGHAVALVGFDDGTCELLLRNSWGESWGAAGHGRLPYAALAVVGRGAWVVDDDIGP
jgi:hypothetical protein